MRSYGIRGFTVGVMFLDIQFKCVKDRNQLGVMVVIVSRGEHVNAIERFHRVIEERCRCYHDMVPFDSLPRVMAVHLLFTVMFYTKNLRLEKGTFQNPVSACNS